jgi:O-antigen/teichoic acid export membrane protein
MATAEPGAAPPPRLGGVSLSSTGVFVVTVLIQFLGYIPTHFFAQNVGETPAGQSVLGTFQLFLLLASSINMIGDLRIGTAYVFFVARGESTKVGTGTYLVLRAAMVAFAGIAVWFVTPHVSNDVGPYLELFALWMVLPVLWSVSTVYSQLLTAQGRSTGGQLPSLIESIVRTAALTYVALGSLHLASQDFASIIAPITYCYLLGAGVSAVYSLPAVWRQLRPYNQIVARRFFKFAWPLMGSLLLLYFSTTIIQFLVVADYGRGVYNVFLTANGFRILALAAPAAVAVPLFPHLTGLHRARDYELIRSRTWAALRYTAFVMIPTAMILVVYRSNLLNVAYSHGYASAGTCLAIMAVSAVPAALSQIIGTALNSVGRQRLELYLTSIQFSVLIGASLLFMTPVGLFGLSPLNAAAIAVLLSSGAALAVNTFFMERLLAVRIQPRPIANLILGAAVGFLAVDGYNFLFAGRISSTVELIPGIVIGFAADAFFLAGIGELSKADVRLIVGALGLPARLGNALARLCWRPESWPVNPRLTDAGEALRPLPSEMPTGSEPEVKGPDRPR